MTTGEEIAGSRPAMTEWVAGTRTLAVMFGLDPSI